MKNREELKELICGQLQELIDQKIGIAMSAMDSAKESRDSDTKSSVGDKYETGRAMMQIELENNKIQLSKALDLKNELSRINIKKVHTRAEPGSLVITNQGDYFISVGLGKIEVNNKDYYSVSLASPIGKLLYNREIGDSVKFQGREFTITDIT